MSSAPKKSRRLDSRTERLSECFETTMRDHGFLEAARSVPGREAKVIKRNHKRLSTTGSDGRGHDYENKARLYDFHIFLYTKMMKSGSNGKAGNWGTQVVIIRKVAFPAYRSRCVVKTDTGERGEQLKNFKVLIHTSETVPRSSGQHTSSHIF